jgi:transposase
MTQAAVLSGPERRRRWSAAEKAQMVEESLAPGLRVTEVARRHDVHPNLLHLWRRQARIGVLSARADDRARFVPVAVARGNEASAERAEAVGVGSMIEVVLRNGRVLRLPEGVTPARAVILADALEGLGR